MKPSQASALLLLALTGPATVLASLKVITITVTITPGVNDMPTTSSSVPAVPTLPPSSIYKAPVYSNSTMTTSTSSSAPPPPPPPPSSSSTPPPPPSPSSSDKKAVFAAPSSSAPAAVPTPPAPAPVAPKVADVAPPPSSGGNQINIINKLDAPVYVNWNCTGGKAPEVLTVAAGSATPVNVPQGWVGAGFIGLQMGHSANTKFEFQFNGWGGMTYFDVDVEKGFSVPMVCTAGDGAAFSGCGIDKLASCPSQWAIKGTSGNPVACSNPQSSEAIDYYSKGCSNYFITSAEFQNGIGQSKTTTSTVFNCVVGASASKRDVHLHEHKARSAKHARHLHSHHMHARLHES